MLIGNLCFRTTLAEILFAVWKLTNTGTRIHYETNNLTT